MTVTTEPTVVAPAEAVAGRGTPRGVGAVLRRCFAGGRLRLGAAALALGLAWLDPTPTLPGRRSEVIAVFDVSQSMQVDDMTVQGVATSRIAAARAALRTALDALPCGTRLGLAVFAEYRTLLLVAPIEVCAHTGELRAMLDRIDRRMAWSGNSEIAKGVHGAIATARDWPSKPALAFFTDGQEAPPLHPRFRPEFDPKGVAIGGVLVGVGGAQPLPIPKTDASGRVVGRWSADDVLQSDIRSETRGGSAGGEAMVGVDAGAGTLAAERAALGATPGREHLSSLREGYLRRLAQDTGLGYLRLDADDPKALARVLASRTLARDAQVPTPTRPWWAALALALLVAPALVRLVARVAAPR